MFIFRKLIAIILGFIVVSTTSPSVIKYTQGEPITAQKRDYCFDTDKLLIGGYFFNRDDCTDEQFEYLRDSGIDYLVAYANDELLDKCEEYGIGVIGISNNLPANSNIVEYKSYWTDFTGENYNDHPALWGDLLIDEPKASAFDDIAQMLEVYYNTPQTSRKLPYINLFPAYASAELLDVTLRKDTIKEISNKFLFGKMALKNTKANPFSEYQNRLADYADYEVDAFKQYVSDYINKVDTDYISCDIYPMLKNDKIDGGWLRSLDILSQACRETNRALSIIVQAAGVKDEDKSCNNRYCDTFEDICWQDMIALSFGAKGISYGCYYSGYIRDIYMGWWDQDSHCIDANGNRTKTYYAVKSANEYIRSFSDEYMDYNHMGAFLTQPYGNNEGSRTGYLLPINGDTKCSVDTKNNVLVGCFEKGEERAYTFVNLESTKQDTKATFSVQFENASEITVYTKEEIKTITSNTLQYTLDTQEGIFVTVK